MTYPSKNGLTPAQQKRAAAVLGAAFCQDPFMTYVFPNARTRIHNTAKLLLPIVRCGLRYGGVEVTPQGDGALVWIPGDQLPLSLWQLVRSGMIWTPMVSGLETFRRIQ
ncbi:MAG: N-acetyltransferase, partial [Cyanobacteria bacterium P01_H01_bin.26]